MIGRENKQPKAFHSQIQKLLGIFAPPLLFSPLPSPCKCYDILGKAHSFLQARFDKIELIGWFSFDFNKSRLKSQSLTTIQFRRQATEFKYLFRKRQRSTCVLVNSVIYLNIFLILFLAFPKVSNTLVLAGGNIWVVSWKCWLVPYGNQAGDQFSSTSCQVGQHYLKFCICFMLNHNYFVRFLCTHGKSLSKIKFPSLSHQFWRFLALTVQIQHAKKSPKFCYLHFWQPELDKNLVWIKRSYKNDLHIQHTDIIVISVALSSLTRCTFLPICHLCYVACNKYQRASDTKSTQHW